MKKGTPASLMPGFIMRVYSLCSGWLRHNRSVFRLLFGFTPPDKVEGILWDWTTLVLRRALRHSVRPGFRLLDMGTGPVAVLGIFARNTLHYDHVCAVDHIPSIVSSARYTATHAHVDIDIRESSLFEFLTERYDIITFNAPYMDSDSGIRLGLLDSELSKRRWCGGKDGLDTIDRFLRDASGYLTPGGTVLLGVNRFYLPRKILEDLTLRRQWTIEWVMQNRWTLAQVYALKPETTPHLLKHSDQS